jgi:predicted Zn-dependent protease
LEQKKFDEAIRHLKRGLELYPDALLIQGNLAHGYLFKKITSQPQPSIKNALAKKSCKYLHGQT